jgi:hypothetical protein
MRALGQAAAASIEVLEDALRIEVSMPWVLAETRQPISADIAQGSNATPRQEIAAPGVPDVRRARRLAGLKRVNLYRLWQQLGTPSPQDRGHQQAQSARVARTR